MQFVIPYLLKGSPVELEGERARYLEKKTNRHITLYLIQLLRAVSSINIYFTVDKMQARIFSHLKWGVQMHYDASVLGTYNKY